MSKRLTDDFVLGRVDWILRETRQDRTPLPVDLGRVCDQLGVKVEWRKMVPEAAVVVRPDGLLICLQDNFREDRRTPRRQRFTWAHEICHSLFFQLDKTPPCPFPGTPKGAILEKMCQRGAGRILLPQVLLEDLFGVSNQVESVGQLLEIAEQFEISPEVVLRRLSEQPEIFASHQGFLLLSPGVGSRFPQLIRFYGGGAWVTKEIPVPQVGQPLEDWLTSVNRTLKPVGNNRWITRSAEVEISVNRDVRDVNFLQLSAHLV